MLVIDASAMLAWCFDDEAPVDAARKLDELVQEGLMAPGLWPLELGNILWAAERSKRIDPARVKEFLNLLSGLAVGIDPETPARALHETRTLAMASGLTVYDAAYLELAMRKGAGLASKDKALLKAAKKLGVRTVAV
jgi:predicted nucleic acid-binding protein